MILIIHILTRGDKFFLINYPYQTLLYVCHILEYALFTQFSNYTITLIR